jgi:hypothetical protein
VADDSPRFTYSFTSLARPSSCAEARGCQLAAAGGGNGRERASGEAGSARQTRHANGENGGSGCRGGGRPARALVLPARPMQMAHTIELLPAGQMRDA